MLSLLLRARDEEGRGMTRGAARRAVHDAGGGARDDRDGAGVRVRAAAAKPAGARAAAGGAGDGEGDEYLDAVAKETLGSAGDRRGGADIDGAADAGRLGAASGDEVYPGIALVHTREDLYGDPHAFRPERSWRTAWSPTHDPVRGRHPAVHRGSACAGGDGGGAAGGDTGTGARAGAGAGGSGGAGGITLAPKHGVQVRVLKRLAQPAPVADPAAVRSTAPVSG